MLARLVGLAGKALATQSTATAPLVARAVESAVSTSAARRIARAFSTNSHDIFNTHKDTPENNANTVFEFTPANLERAKEIMQRYPPNYKQSAVIPVLDLVQQQNNGYLSLAAMNSVAKLLEMPEIKVYEVATFYSMFNRSKIGKIHIQVCGTTPCRVQGSEKILAAVEKHLGIHLGETTKDGMFTVSEMECLGACVNAPMIAIADYRNGVEGYSYIYYEDLTPEDTIRIIEMLRRGETPKPGSQYRSMAEPAGCIDNGKWVPSKGENTLTTPPRGPYAPNL